MIHREMGGTYPAEQFPRQVKGGQMKAAGSYFIIRPTWEKIQVPGAGVYGCSCGQSLWTMGELREHWQLGHFDRIINPGDEGYDKLVSKMEEV